VGRPRLRQQGPPARQTCTRCMIPVVPGLLLATGSWSFGHDLGTALVLFAILLGMLWVVGAPARLLRRSHLAGQRARALPRHHQPERLPRITNFADPFKDYHDAGWQPAHGLYALSSGGCSARASAPASRSGATCPRRTPTSSSPCSARSSAWSAPCSCSAVPHHRLRRAPGRHRTATRSCATCPSASSSGCSAR
jgi:hypothetical protein